MENLSYSKSQYGSIYIRTDKALYFPGEVVTGKVYLNFIQQGFSGLIVNLKIKGRETCHWKEYIKAVRSHHGTKLFYCNKIQLHKFEDVSLSQGQYVFPFQFTLLKNLPGSFSEKNVGYSAYISYKLKAEVGSSKDKIKYQQEIILRELLKSQGVIEYTQSVMAKTCLCFNQGLSKISCSLDKNRYVSGEQANLRIDVDNSECNLQIKDIEIVLSQTIVLKSDKGHLHVVNKIMVKETLSGMSRKSKSSNQNSQIITISLQNNNSIVGESKLLKPSTTGKMIKSSYNISVVALLKGCRCCSKDPSVNIPMNISPSILLSNQQIYRPPANWNPQIFQLIHVVFSKSNQYTESPILKQKMIQKSQNKNLNQLNKSNKMSSDINLNQNHSMNQIHDWVYQDTI